MAWKKVQSEYERKQNLQKLFASKRKFVEYTLIDQCFRKEHDLSILQYMILDEIYRKQNLPQRVAFHRAGWYWGSRQHLADLFNVKVDAVDKVVRLYSTTSKNTKLKKPRQSFLDVDKKTGNMRVDPLLWKPDIATAKMFFALSMVYPEISKKLKISYDEQCFLNLIAFSLKANNDVVTRLTDKEIAQRLGVSERTVKRLISKLSETWIEVEKPRYGNQAIAFRKIDGETYAEKIERYQEAKQNVNQSFSDLHESPIKAIEENILQEEKNMLVYEYDKKYPREGSYQGT